MQYKKINEGYGYAIVMARGERIREKLVEFAQAEGVKSAYFSAIGAVENVKLGHYDLTSKTYSFQEYPEISELASLQGNIVPHENKPSVHMHAVLQNTEGQVMAGHLDNATVALTLEMFLHLLDGADINKKFDEQIGLPLWNLNK
jgi:predicted DNA-binding protein with PD1-like motif